MSMLAIERKEKELCRHSDSVSIAEILSMTRG